MRLPDNIDHRNSEGTFTMKVTATDTLSWDLEVWTRHPSGITTTCTAPDLTIKRVHRDAERYIHEAQAEGLSQKDATAAFFALDDFRLLP